LQELPDDGSKGDHLGWLSAAGSAGLQQYAIGDCADTAKMLRVSISVAPAKAADRLALVRQMSKCSVP
jgi:hypothetical protein